MVYEIIIMKMNLTEPEREIHKAYNTIFGFSKSFSNDTLLYLDPCALKSAFRKKALETHPDRSTVTGKNEDEMKISFVKTVLAYQTLMTALNDIRQERKPAGCKTEMERHEFKTVCRSDAGDLYYKGMIPKRKLMIGQFLYYSGIISWKKLIEAITWQRMQRPQIGRIAMKWGMLTEQDVLLILKERNLERKFDKRFGEYARIKGYISTYELFALLGKQRMLNRPIGEYFIRNKIIPASDMERLVEKLKVHNSSASL
jgi:hypothetical protein